MTSDAIAEANAIFEEVDLDGNGEIEFSEWIVASIKKKSLLAPEKLKLAFQLFDKDKTGSINMAEVKETLTGGCDVAFDSEEERFWADIIDEVDLDGNGEIEQAEFSAMIKKIIT